MYELWLGIELSIIKYIKGADNPILAMNTNTTTTKEVYKVKGEGKPVLKVYESFNGDLYFLTEKADKDGYVFCYARLYSMPQFAEWGTSNIEYLKEQYGEYKLWEVKPQNWRNINSYEDGLLIKA